MKNRIIAIFLATLFLSSVAACANVPNMGPTHHAKSSYGLEFRGSTRDMVMRECLRVTPADGTCEYGGLR